MLGISEERFWDSIPVELEPYREMDKMQQERLDYQMWQMGAYVTKAVSVAVDNVLNGKLDEVVDEIKYQLKPDSVDVVEDMALIATVGAGMSARKGTSARLFTALAEAGVNIRMIDQGSSEMNIIVGVEKKDFETAIKAIYKAFVE